MKMYTKENLSSLIKAYRKENNKSQKQFAEEAGVSLRMISRIEGKPQLDNPPSVTVVEKILKVLDCKLIIAKNI